MVCGFLTMKESNPGGGQEPKLVHSKEPNKPGEQLGQEPAEGVERKYFMESILSPQDLRRIEETRKELEADPDFPKEKIESFLDLYCMFLVMGPRPDKNPRGFSFS